jgi:hypothetical protein
MQIDHRLLSDENAATALAYGNLASNLNFQGKNAQA